MKLSDVREADFAASVLAVPPLARRADGMIDRAANARIVRHVEAGGVTTLLYAGNANLAHAPVSEYAALLDMLEELAGPDTWMIPAIGPDYGRMIDQAAILATRRFPTATILPATAPFDQAGVEEGVLRAAEAAGRPLMLYLRSAQPLRPEQIGRLHRRGAICGVKYAVEATPLTSDPFLTALLGHFPAARMVSGMGERPALTHMRDFGLAGFTSGCVVIAPALSQAMLHAARAGDWAQAEALRALFAPLEDARERMGFIRTLHDAVTIAGIADTGRLLPLVSPLTPAERATITPLVNTLLQATAPASAA